MYSLQSIALFSLANPVVRVNLLPNRPVTNGTAQGDEPSKSVSEKRQRTVSNERTTQMLITVLVVFVLCELPQGILGILTGTQRLTQTF